MVWINRQCFNESVPKGSFGGSRCICEKCEAKRKLEYECKESKKLRNKYRHEIKKSFGIFFGLMTLNTGAWDILAEYFTHE